MSALTGMINKLFMDSAGNFSKWATINTAANAYFTYDSYNESRNEGSGIISSAVKAGAEMALMTQINPFLYMGVSLLPSLARGGVDAYNSLGTYSRRLQRERRNVPFSNATFVDTQQTYTMRQAGMNLIKNGQYVAQQTMLGNEASALLGR